MTDDIDGDVNDDAATGPTDDQPSGSGFPRWLTWALLGALAILVLGYGAIFLYAKVINDAPDELDESDLSAALADEPSAETDPSALPVTDPPTDAASDNTDFDNTDSDNTDSDNTTPSSTDAAEDQVVPAGAAAWVTTEASELGYRVKEVLFGVDTEGVGRTNEVDGTITIDGTQVTSGEFVVDVATITSDQGRRDGQFRGRIMSTDEFPEATFVLTEPIDLGTEPVDGTQLTTSATGELTLRGVTNPVTFDLDARLENGRIGVLGSIPIVFSEYGIPNPSNSAVTTGDDGLLEFVLVFESA